MWIMWILLHFIPSKISIVLWILFDVIGGPVWNNNESGWKCLTKKPNEVKEHNSGNWIFFATFSLWRIFGINAIFKGIVKSNIFKVYWETIVTYFGFIINVFSQVFYNTNNILLAQVSSFTKNGHCCVINWWPIRLLLWPNRSKGILLYNLW